MKKEDTQPADSRITMPRVSSRSSHSTLAKLSATLSAEERNVQSRWLRKYSAQHVLFTHRYFHASLLLIIENKDKARPALSPVSRPKGSFAGDKLRCLPSPSSWSMSAASTTRLATADCCCRLVCHPVASGKCLPTIVPPNNWLLIYVNSEPPEIRSSFEIV